MAEENESPLAPYATPSSDPVHQSLEQKEVSLAVIEALGATKITTMICSVAGFIAVGLMLWAAFTAMPYDASGFAILLLIATVSFFAPYFAFRYSRSVTRVTKSLKEEDLVKALKNQSLFWGYICILACLWGFLMLLALLGAIA
ncbi:hypothetical protein Rhal01_03632 [Rubritalea halochordaticola]|uniref:Uncharacterized protein n=1 Tax=Rubritalea halochordaticola TaxID=714537 RepID=A0ABP9V8N9_9BACT